ncbi:unnamed protein product [Owenia fusiformis]|uniref:Uncharacterized protein n=1 Tax=Owenia fusiformis TaxID=6347 RepID=A0A8J1Y0S6_OWEFU|nr:unnamed protein product [Owenia fusiformis]
MVNFKYKMSCTPLCNVYSQSHRNEQYIEQMLAIIILAVFVGCFGQNQPDPDLAETWFYIVDLNADNIAEPHELESFYFRYDGDRDGVVTVEEFVNHTLNWPDDFNVSKAEGPSYFKLQDLDGNNQIDGDDVTLWLEDVNQDEGDDVVGFEFKWGARRVFRAVRLMMILIQYDSDGFDSLSRDEFNSFFNDLDTNNDTRVDLQEFTTFWTNFQGGDAADAAFIFRKMDWNEDGVWDQANDVNNGLYGRIDKDPQDGVLQFNEWFWIDQFVNYDLRCAIVIPGGNYKSKN